MRLTDYRLCPYDQVNEPLLKEAPTIDDFKEMASASRYAKGCIAARARRFALSAAGLLLAGFSGCGESRFARIETGIGLTMVRIEPRPFTMGTPGNAGVEKAHHVTVTRPYWIGETEVTQKQWLDVMKTTPWKGERCTAEGDSVAATYVSWNDAVAFCDKLTASEQAAGRLPEGYRYGLPSEAEWEFACRGGSQAGYCFGDAEGVLPDYAVFLGSRDGEHASAVKSKKPNAFGLYDMHGNVYEWCSDHADLTTPDHIKTFIREVLTDTYRNNVTDPVCLSGSLRVFRGGSWTNPPAGCRSAMRSCDDPALRFLSLGFRPALLASSSRR